MHYYLVYSDRLKKTFFDKSKLITEIVHVFTPMPNDRYLHMIRYSKGGKKDSVYIVTGIVYKPKRYDLSELVNSNVTRDDVTMMFDIEGDDFRRHQRREGNIVIVERKYNNEDINGLVFTFYIAEEGLGFKSPYPYIRILDEQHYQQLKAKYPKYVLESEEELTYTPRLPMSKDKEEK